MALLLPYVLYTRGFERAKKCIGRDGGLFVLTVSDATNRVKYVQEDDSIVKLVDKYGTKRWTYIAQMLKDDYRISGRTGK